MLCALVTRRRGCVACVAHKAARLCCVCRSLGGAVVLRVSLTRRRGCVVRVAH